MSMMFSKPSVILSYIVFFYCTALFAINDPREFTVYRQKPTLIAHTLNLLHHRLSNVLEIMNESGITEGATELSRIREVLPSHPTQNLESDIAAISQARLEFQSVLIAKGVGDALTSKGLITPEILSHAIESLPQEVRDHMQKVPKPPSVLKSALIRMLDHNHPGLIAFLTGAILSNAADRLFLGEFNQQIILLSLIMSAGGAYRTVIDFRKVGSFSSLPIRTKTYLTGFAIAVSTMLPGCIVVLHILSEHAKIAH
jgi:hypothetical protein